MLSPTDRLHRLVMGDWVTPPPVPFPLLPPVTHVRGTVLANSRALLKEKGHFSAYEAALSPGARADLDAQIAMSWVPIELALRHFEAVDSLSIPDALVREYTTVSVRKITGTTMVALTQTARNVGVTPLTVLPKATGLWTRLFTGGAICIRQTGPKDMLLVAMKSPILASRYHRIGVGMQVKVIGELFSKRCFIRENEYFPDAHVYSFTLQWT